jgi:hypothetical protein
MLTISLQAPCIVALRPSLDALFAPSQEINQNERLFCFGASHQIHYMAAYRDGSDRVDSSMKTISCGKHGPPE